MAVICVSGDEKAIKRYNGDYVLRIIFGLFLASFKSLWDVPCIIYIYIKKSILTISSPPFSSGAMQPNVLYSTYIPVSSSYSASTALKHEPPGRVWQVEFGEFPGQCPSQ